MNFEMFTMENGLLFYCLQNDLDFQSKQRKQPAFREAQRRAQSEGPGIRNPLFRVAPDEPDIRPTVPGSSTRSASARRGRRTVTHDTQVSKK